MDLINNMFLRNENTYPKKVLEKLQGFNRSAPNWEWADLIFWTQEFKSLIEKYQIEELPGPLVLETLKSLSFCFKSGLPEGVQFKILEIFVLMGQAGVTKQKNLVILSLLTFFHVCSNLVKVKILENIEKLIENCYEFSVDSVVAGVFQGIEEKGEVFDSVCGVIKKIGKNKDVEVHNALWKVVITSKNKKMPVLTLLKTLEIKDECRDLMLNGILSALYDQNLRVKRIGLDLIKTHFPIGNTEIWRTDKILLLKAALIVSDSREPTVLRRLWEWIYPLEMSDESESTSLLAETFLDIQSTSQDKNLAIRIAELICSSEFGTKVFEGICLDLLIFIIKYLESITCSLPPLIELMKPIKFVLLEKISQNFESFLQMSEELGYSILSFILSNKLQSGSFAYSVFHQLLVSFEFLENKISLYNILEFLSIHMNEVPPLYKLTNSIIKYLANTSNKEFLQKIVNILKNFEKNGLDIETFLLDIKTKVKITSDNDKYRLIQFLGNFEKSPISSVESQFLWKKLLRKEEIFELILQMGKYKKELVNIGLLDLLNKGKIGVQAFLKFWQRASATEIIETLSPDLISVIINLLENHEGLRPWIQSIDTKAFIVIDYLLVTILDPITVRMPANRIYVYENIFNHSSFTEKLKMLKSFLSNISYIAINSLLLQDLSTRVQEFLKIHKLTANKYMQALVKTLVSYMLAQPFDELTLLSIDCLELLTQLLPQNLMNYLVRKGIRCLEHAIPQDNITVQVSVMNLISPLLLKINEKYFIRLCDWREFTNCLLSGCFSKDAIIRRLWRNTVVKSLQIVGKYSSEESLTQYYDALVKGISHYLVTEKDVALITTLNCILNSVFQHHLAHFFKLVVRSFESIIRIGADFLMLAGDVYQDRHPMDTIKEVFKCLVERFPQELIDSFIFIWSKYCQNKPDYISVLLVLIQQFQLPLESIFLYILRFLQKDAKDSKSNKEIQVFVAFLIYKLTLETSIISDFVKNYERLWENLQDLLNELLKSPHSEVSALLLKLLSIVQLDFQSFYNNSTKSTKKQLKEFVGKLFESIFSNIFIRRKQCLPIPYPDFDSDCEVHELCLHYMIKHAYDTAFFVCIGETLPCSLFISNCCLNLLFNLPNTQYGKRQALAFIVSSLKYEELRVAEKIRKNVFELFFHEAFLMDSPECIRGFCQILQFIVKLESSNNAVLLKVLETYKEGWIFNRKDSKMCSKKIARVGLLIMSGDIDQYKECLEYIEGLLNSAFNEFEIFKFFCVLIKVLYLKMNQILFSLIWKKFYYLFCIKSFEYFETKSDPDALFEFLRLIEFFSVTGYEEFFTSLYLFVPDVPYTEKSENLVQSLPILLKSYSSNKCIKAIWNSTVNNDLTVYKSFTICREFNGISELEQIIHSFSQVCMCYSTQSPSDNQEEVFEEVERELHSLFLNCA